MRSFLKSKKIIILILLIFLLIILNLTGFSKTVKGFFYLISSPIQKTLWQAGDNLSDFFEGFLRAGTFKRENEELKLKIQELLAENVSLKEFKRENETLREALDIGLEKEFELVLAQVIGKDISQDFILINKGSRDGILKEMPVITQSKILCGKISEVYEKFSKVMLLSNKESVFEARIETQTKAQTPENENKEKIAGVIKGKGGLKVFLEFIPKEKEIKEGQLLITTSLAGIYPQGLLVGQVKKVEKSDVEPFQQAEILPFLKLEELNKVFIITNH